jgi:hypothetical protein
LNTEFLSKATPKQKATAIIGGGTGLSAAALIFLYQAFATKGELELMNSELHRQLDKAEYDSKIVQSKQWQRLMDLQLEIDRLKRRSTEVDR